MVMTAGHCRRYRARRSRAPARSTTSRFQESRQRSRQVAAVVVMTARTMTGPGQPSHRQAMTSRATKMSATGCRAMNRISRHSSRNACAVAIIQIGVCRTGARSTGLANGSGLATWTICSPENGDRLIGPVPPSTLSRSSAARAANWSQASAATSCASGVSRSAAMRVSSCALHSCRAIRSARDAKAG